MWQSSSVVGEKEELIFHSLERHRKDWIKWKRLLCTRVKKREREEDDPPFFPPELLMRTRVLHKEPWIWVRERIVPFTHFFGVFFGGGPCILHAMLCSFEKMPLKSRNDCNLLLLCVPSSPSVEKPFAFNRVYNTPKFQKRGDLAPQKMKMSSPISPKVSSFSWQIWSDTNVRKKGEVCCDTGFDRRETKTNQLWEPRQKEGGQRNPSNDFLTFPTRASGKNHPEESWARSVFFGQKNWLLECFLTPKNFDPFRQPKNKTFFLPSSSP